MGKSGSLALAGGALGEETVLYCSAIYCRHGNPVQLANITWDSANTTLALLVVVPSNSASSALDTLSTQAHGGSKISSVKNLNRLYSMR
jgi:hypothetical protein